MIIVAELTANHLGNIDRCLSMMDKALEAGADYVKVQRRNVETFYSRDKKFRLKDSPYGTTFGEYRWGLELSDRDFDKIDANFQGRWFASALDWDSYVSLKPYGTPFMKLPSTISSRRQFIADVARDWSGGLVMSLGMTDQEAHGFIEATVNWHSERSRSDDYVLQCTSAYPAPFTELNLGLISSMDRSPSNLFHVGYSSHDGGYIGSMMAVAAGAEMIEKHVSVPGAEWVERNEVAVNLDNGDFKRFCDMVRVADRAVGTGHPGISKSEDHKY